MNEPFVQASQWAPVSWWEKTFLSPLDSWMAPRRRDGPISLLSFVILTAFPLFNCTLEGNKESTCSSTFNTATYTDTRRRESDACRYVIPIPVQSSAALPGSAVALSWCQATTQFDDHNGCHLELRSVCCVTLKTSSLLKDVFMQKKTSTVGIKERQRKDKKMGIKKKDGPLFFINSVGVQWFLRKRRHWNE